MLNDRNSHANTPFLFSVPGAFGKRYLYDHFYNPRRIIKDVQDAEYFSLTGLIFFVRRTKNMPLNHRCIGEIIASIQH